MEYKDMKIGLFGPASKEWINRGPGKVYNNTLKGLKLNGCEVVENGYGDYNGSFWPGDHPSNTLMGPNIMVVPSDQPGFWKKYNHYVVPSQWVYDKYKSFALTKDINIYIWSAGIDTELFKPKKDIQYDCLVYFKNRQNVDLDVVTSFLNSKNLTYNVIRYGSYTEKHLIDLCNKSKYCILIDNTESQGIAYMEMLSMDIPIYVLDQKVWNNRFPATSVPWFDDRCGLIVDNIEDKTFDKFLSKEHEPRKYILENHTLEISAEKYIKILKKIKDES